MTTQVGDLLWGDFSPEPGISLRYAWMAPQGKPRGTMMVIPGRTEFIEKYLEVMNDLSRRGWATWTFDLRGQGLSTRLLPNRNKGHIDSFQTYQRDLRAMLQLASADKQRSPGPLCLFAHSLGSLLALHHCLDHPAEITCAFLSAPMLGVPSPLPEPVVVWTARILMALGLGDQYVGKGDYGDYNRRFEGNPWTSDADRMAHRVKLIEENPQLCLGGITVQWLYAAIRSMQQINRRGQIESLRVPTLMVASGDDHCVRTEATLALARRAPDCVSLEVIPGAQHELLFERDRFRDRFWRHVDDFCTDLGV